MLPQFTDEYLSTDLYFNQPDSGHHPAGGGSSMSVKQPHLLITTIS